MSERILLDHGSGGKASHRLIRELFYRYLDNPLLSSMDDAARLELNGPLAFSTDTYTVDPLFFPGGDIGSLAVHGTVNDVAMLGAVPEYLSCAFIIEEGLETALLEKVVASMAAAARACRVQIVTGDTKVAPRGAVDRLFINTSGLGRIIADPSPSGSRARDGDAVIVSGSLGEHGLTIMTSRAGFDFTDGIQSDSAPLKRPVQSLLERIKDIHVLRDPTRGGLATTLGEIAAQSGVTIVIEEETLPVKAQVAAGCKILGLDPLYLANEGKFICILPEARCAQALEVLRRDPLCAEAARIGSVRAGQGPDSGGQVVLRTRLGGQRLLGMLEGQPLPRIC